MKNIWIDDELAEIIEAYQEAFQFLLGKRVTRAQTLREMLKRVPGGLAKLKENAELVKKGALK